MEAFGGKGYFVSHVAELQPALEEAVTSKTPSLVNIQIDPSGPTPKNVQQHQKK